MSAVLYLALLLPLQIEAPADAEKPPAVQDAKADAEAGAPKGDAADGEKTDGDAKPDEGAEAGPATFDPEGDDQVDEGDDSWYGKLDEITDAGAIGFIKKGGVFMWPILIMGIIAAGVLIERFRSLKMLTADPGNVRGQVVDLLKQDRVEQALKLCEQEEGPVPAILSAGLRKYYVLRTLNYDPAKVEEQVVKAMDDYGVHVVAALEKHLPVLATISSAAPMLGFLGTVSGMVVSFNEIEAKIGQDNIVKLASGGISVALLTTAFGLIVGIPAFMGFNYFSGVINRFVLEVEESATELIETVTLQMALERAAEETV
jgi:biopolymer transport protein ExbB